VKPRLSVVVALAAAAALAGCDKPKPRHPGPAAAAAPRINTTTTAVPAPPAWLADVLGKKLADAFPQPGACKGVTDGVDMHYQGGSPGTRIAGWAWDTVNKTPVPRVVLVDKDLQIVGGGESGALRPDVVAGQTDVTSPMTGWTAVTTLTTGSLDTYGLVGGQATCRLGHVDF